MSVVIGYTLVYFGCVTIQKTLFHTYSSQVLSLVHNNSLELLTLVVYLYIFRSRRLPIYFNVMIFSKECNLPRVLLNFENFFIISDVIKYVIQLL